VNKKALDQFVSFNEQREALIEKRAEMEKDNGAIQQMIDSLDAQKDEAILRTFRGVSHYFSEVFSELVPGGNGKLVMKTTMDAANAAAASGEEEDKSAAGTQSLEDHVLADKDNDNEQNPEMLRISTFMGVQVSVSFSGSGQQYQMQQLSGGQKALVALALIFAIQRCDPAPFYLFDEIDQALDANYRAGVARLIQKQVESETAPAQFITTTFRPELVAVADKCYGIALANKVSNIHTLAKVNY
jgi:structural maintenance of chromosome 3 (chondroitin sulfate proteoglycan 6)